MLSTVTIRIFLFVTSVAVVSSTDNSTRPDEHDRNGTTSGNIGDSLTMVYELAFQSNSYTSRNFSLTCSTHLHVSYYRIDWSTDQTHGPQMGHIQTDPNNTFIISYSMTNSQSNSTFTACKPLDNYDTQLRINMHGVELDELLWNSIERNIFANAIELTFNLDTYVGDKIKVKLTRLNDGIQVHAGYINLKNSNIKLQMNNLTSNTAYLLQMYKIRNGNVTLALNQSLKTLSYRSKIQRFDYKAECKVDKDRRTVKMSVNTNRTSNVDIELQRQSNGSYEVMRTPCASQCNFTLNADHVSMADTTYNMLINFDDTQVIMSKCETVDNRTQVQRLHEAKILNCKRISEAHIQLKVFHNWTDALGLQPNGSHDLWFHVDYKYLNDVGFKTVDVRKENDLQLIKLNDTKDGTSANDTTTPTKLNSYYKIRLSVYSLTDRHLYTKSPDAYVECKQDESSLYIQEAADPNSSNPSPTQAAIYGVIVTASILLTLILLLITIGIGFFLMRKKSMYTKQKHLNKHSLFRNSSNKRRRQNSLLNFSLNLKRTNGEHMHQSKSLLANNPTDKYSTFNSNYVRLLKQKWHSNTNQRSLNEICKTTATNTLNTSFFNPVNLTYSLRHKLRHIKYKDESDSIDVPSFDEYVQKMHQDGDFGFAQLYEEVCATTKSYNYRTEVALMDVNRNKNRYSNILTYDHSRVKLLCDDKDESLGYINANYIDGYHKPNSYIATQGPMPHTFNDFWRMIWEQNCSIIVMITNIREKGRIKCDQYWPSEGFELYGNMQVTLLHTLSLAFYTKRIFTVKLKTSRKRSSTERLVYQYHFTDWPDHGVPYYILPVLSFIRKTSRENPEFSGPVIVHCSAGVGRTGCYIVIEAMLKQIENKRSINAHTFLKHIRHQRNYLVQTEEQFIFIYDVILESIKSGETELTGNNYKAYMNQLTSTLDEKGLKFIDKQFQLITEFKPKDYHYSFAQMSYNLAKNRNQNIIPLNTSRAILSKKPGVDGSEYINATYLHGSTDNDEFIITQHPISEIKSNFWQMVWDNNSTLVLGLYSDDKLDDCEAYWLKQDSVLKCDSFTVQLKDELFDMDFVYRDFLLQSIDEDYEFNCRIISASYWPDGCVSIKSAFELVNRVRQFRVTLNSSNSSTGPIIVHDLHGGYRAATFCCLYTFQDLIQHEGSVNVYELSKMYHLKRPGIWSSSGNILFLYQAVEHIFDEYIQKQASDKTESKLNTTSTMTSTTSTYSSLSSAINCCDNKTPANNTIDKSLATKSNDNHCSPNSVDSTGEQCVDFAGDDTCTESTNKRISNMFVRKFTLVLNMSSNLRRSLLLSLKKQQANDNDVPVGNPNGSVAMGINIDPNKNIIQTDSDSKSKDIQYETKIQLAQ